jgi:hypothetical protein
LCITQAYGNIEQSLENPICQSVEGELVRPFDLEKALAGEPVVTRSGKKVTQLTHFKYRDLSQAPYPLYGVIESLTLNYWTFEGKAAYRSCESNDDLFMASTKQTAVVEVWRYKNGEIAVIIKRSDKDFRAGDSVENTGSIWGRTLVHIQQIEWEE